MKYIIAVMASCILSSCVAPSLTIYGKGIVTGKDGIRRAVAVKEAQLYGDLVGRSSIVGSVVAIHTEGGYYNSTVTRENYNGMAKVGRAVVQPIVMGLVTAGAANAVAGAAASTIPAF